MIPSGRTVGMAGTATMVEYSGVAVATGCVSVAVGEDSVDCSPMPIKLCGIVNVEGT